METKHTYEYSTGRTILRDGVSFASIHRCIHHDGGGAPPTEVDEFAHLCARAPGLLAEVETLRAQVARLREVTKTAKVMLEVCAITDPRGAEQLREQAALMGTVLDETGASGSERGE